MKKRRKQKPAEWIDSLTATATYISQKYKISCTKHLIKYWQKKEPPFPTATANNRFNIAQVGEWVEKHYLPNQNKLEEGLLAREQTANSTRKILAAENEQFDLDLKRGKYIERDEAWRRGNLAIQKLYHFTRATVERGYPEKLKLKLVEFGVPGEIADKLFEWALVETQSIIDSLAEKCDAETKGLDAISI